MATHSSVLAWKISGTGEPGGLPSKHTCINLKLIGMALNTLYACLFYLAGERSTALEKI